MAIAEGLAAISSLKPLYDLAREMRDASDPEKLRVAASQMFDLALAAREQVALLQEQRNAAVIELTALKAEIEKADAFDKKTENYTRERTHSGATVYREKESSGPEGESPYYCPNCFGHKKLSILNPTGGKGEYRSDLVYGCAICKTAMPLPKLTPR